MDATIQPDTSRAQETGIRVVNIGGPLDNFITPRSLRPDFRHVDLNPGPNTIVADVNKVDLRTLVGEYVQFLRASNVPFVEIPTGAFVEPSAFVLQAQRLQPKRIVITTGIFSILPISDALTEAGFSVQQRVIHQRTFITARR